jgi:hypothetical protein
MSTLTFADAGSVLQDLGWEPMHQTALLSGEILTKAGSHSTWGGRVTALMYLPKVRSHIWQQLTDYSRWVEFFPDKRLYQVAKKAFLLFTAQVEVYLRVLESVPNEASQKIQFRMEQGNFLDFSADLVLQDWGGGTLLKYAVQATPDFPVPTVFIQQAMQLELPANMRKMRQVLCTAHFS